MAYPSHSPGSTYKNGITDSQGYDPDQWNAESFLRTLESSKKKKCVKKKEHVSYENANQSQGIFVKTRTESQ